jgi:hypothetical protein
LLVHLDGICLSRVTPSLALSFQQPISDYPRPPEVESLKVGLFC